MSPAEWKAHWVGRLSKLPYRDRKGHESSPAVIDERHEAAQLVSKTFLLDDTQRAHFEELVARAPVSELEGLKAQVAAIGRQKRGEKEEGK